MLIRFVVSNFLSFDKEQEFNMLAGSYRNHKHHVYKAGKLNVLKGSAIYGANGAGKSNFVKAIEFLKNVVINGGIQTSINSKKFKLNKDNLSASVEFEIEFYSQKKIYAYGISINKQEIEKEWLYLSGIDVEDKLVFERENNKNGHPTIKLSHKYLKTQKSKLLIKVVEENVLKNNELFLGKADILKITDIDIVRDWIMKKLIFIYPKDKVGNLITSITNSVDFTAFTNKALKTFDTGVSALTVEDINFDVFFGNEEEATKKELIEKLDEHPFLPFVSSNEVVMAVKKSGKYSIKRLVTIHNNEDNKAIPFSLAEESDGTKRLLDFIPVFYNILHSDATFIIDEIDQSLHPNLLYTLIKKIMEEKNAKGQLLLTTHEANLLDLNIFRQDEIWFAEKNKAGATQLYSLSAFNPRNDLDIQKGYLKGRFGAIPFTADLKNLNWQEHDA